MVSSRLRQGKKEFHYRGSANAERLTCKCKYGVYYHHVGNTSALKYPYLISNPETLLENGMELLCSMYSAKFARIPRDRSCDRKPSMERCIPAGSSKCERKEDEKDEAPAPIRSRTALGKSKASDKELES